MKHPLHSDAEKSAAHTIEKILRREFSLSAGVTFDAEELASEIVVSIHQQPSDTVVITRNIFDGLERAQLLLRASQSGPTFSCLADDLAEVCPKQTFDGKHAAAPRLIKLGHALYTLGGDEALHKSLQTVITAGGDTTSLARLWYSTVTPNQLY